jgi:hypothetical protein
MNGLGDLSHVPKIPGSQTPQSKIQTKNSSDLADLDNLINELDSLKNLTNESLISPSYAKLTSDFTEENDLEVQRELAEIEKNSSPEDSAPTPVHIVTKQKEPYHLTLSKIEKFVLKILNKLSFIPQVKVHLLKHKDAQAEVAVKGSLARRDLHRGFEPYKINQDQATKNVVISSALLADPKKLERSLKHHEGVAKAASGNKAHKNIDPFETDVGKMLAYSFEKTGGLTPGRVTPTSYVLANKDHNHLTNAYVIQVEGKDYGIIRSAKIDTQQKAEEFTKLLEHLHAQIAEKKPGYQMRVVSQQLNSFETEHKIINAQHRWIVDVNSKLKDKNLGEIVHINIPSNRFYNYTKALQKMGPIGAFFYKFSGERHSREQNLESLSSYVKWTLRDIKSEELPAASATLSDAIQRRKNEEKCQNYIDDLVQKIFDKKQALQLGVKAGTIKPETKAEYQKQMKTWSHELENARQEMKMHLYSDHEYLKGLEKNFKEDIEDGKINESLQSNLQKASLMRQFLGSQLNLPGASLDRGKEGMVIQMLNSHLNITAAMNCKSGLDRTGLWHAVKLAMEGMDKTLGPNRSFQLVNEWETTSTQLNRLYANLGQEKVNAWLEGEDIDLTQILGADVGDLDVLKEKMRDVIEFRKLVLNHLIRIGIPITIASTGLMGLKWNSGMQQNLIPLNFLPYSIDIEQKVHFNASQVEDIGKKGAALVEYDPKTGYPTKITHDGSKLLTKFQSHRGS